MRHGRSRDGDQPGPARHAVLSGTALNRTVLVPDLEPDLAQRLCGLEEFLLGFAGAEPDDVDGVPEPVALLGRV